MLSLSLLKLEYPQIFTDFHSHVLGNNFPCIHAKASLQKKFMYFGVSISNINVENVAKDLSELSCHLDSIRTDDEMSFNTYVHIVDNHDIVDVTSFMLNFLQKLHDLDKCSWSQSATVDMNNQNFEFYYNNRVWVPILLSKEHPTILRRAPFTIIAFQPGVTFDYNKSHKASRYNKIRKLTHEKMKKTYKKDLPFYLSSKSSGKNIIQYIGKDENEFKVGYSYPKII